MIPRYFTAFALVGLFIGLALRKRPYKQTLRQTNSGQVAMPIPEPIRREDGRYSSH
jgi:hypothetical protein